MPNDQTPPRSSLSNFLEATDALGREHGIDYVTIKVGGKGTNASVKDWHKSVKITERAAFVFGEVLFALSNPKYDNTYEEVEALVEQLEGLLPGYEQAVKDMLDEVIPEDVIDSNRMLGLKMAIYALKTGWHV